uniref:Uncharacterized protein n=1 Tax=Oryza sativa subsp. japonica TaxID=39947 RepID=Q2R4X5_ORYSJ|nr:hypothetical protein LOC_Os11g26970 [Oryza sativa Japonica Group]
MDFDITALEGYYATRIAHTCTLEGLKKYVMPPSLLLFLGETSCRKLSNKDWKVIEQRIEKKNLVVGKVIFRATYWLRLWAQLQKCEEDGEFLNVACRNLETTVMQLFANHG